MYYENNKHEIVHSLAEIRQYSLQAYTPLKEQTKIHPLFDWNKQRNHQCTQFRVASFICGCRRL